MPIELSAIQDIRGIEIYLYQYSYWTEIYYIMKKDRKDGVRILQKEHNQKNWSPFGLNFGVNIFGTEQI